MRSRIALRPLIVTLCLWALAASAASAGQIIGVTYSRGLYSVDAQTGTTTQLLAGFYPGVAGPYFGAAGSADSGSIYISSVVNLWKTDVTSFTLIGPLPIGPLDLAFDRATNTLYGTNGSALFYANCGIWNCVQAGQAFPVSQMQALGFVPGVGLYGVAADNLYLIDPNSGLTTLIGATGLAPDMAGYTNVTDIAYDPGTGRLIASVGCWKGFPSTLNAPSPCDESHPGSIYWIDPKTGHATVLQAVAPQLMGLAEVVPEPGSALLVAGALGVVLIWRWRRVLVAWALRLGLLLAAILVLAHPAQAGPIFSLSFDSLATGEDVLNYYNGGLGSLGSGPGPSYGIVFSPGWIAGPPDIHSGSGGQSVGLFSTATMDIAAGYSGVMSFYYSGPAMVVDFYDQQDGMGNLVAAWNLPFSSGLGFGFPAGGTLPMFRSAVFQANGDRTDVLTFGASVIPEPPAYTLIVLGMVFMLLYRLPLRHPKL